MAEVEYSLNKKHFELLDLLIEWANNPTPDNPDKFHGLTDVMNTTGLDEPEAGKLLQAMEQLGVLDDVGHRHGFPFSFQVNAFKAEQIKKQIDRQIAEKEAEPKPNIVKQFKDWTHRSPWTAWPIVAFAIFVAIATAANQIVSLIEKILYFGK